MKKKMNKKGFTLAELLIVIAIIGILIAIAIPVFSSALDSAKETTDKANIRGAYAQYTLQLLEGNLDSKYATMTDALAKTYVEEYLGESLKIYTKITIQGNGSWVGSKT